MKLAIFGYGGHAREVAAQINQPIEFFVNDEYANEFAKSINKFDPEEYKIMVAISDSKLRNKVVDSLPRNTKFFTFIHPTALVLNKDVKIGEGSFIGAYSILTSNIKIGNHAILNRGNHIGHDTQIGNYFSAMPGSIVSGNVTIGNNCYLGSNGTIKEKIVITDDVKIGSNAAVVKHINESGIYVGVPAILKKK